MIAYVIHAPFLATGQHHIPFGKYGSAIVVVCRKQDEPGVTVSDPA